MTSLRHNTEPRDSYLDAARDCILDVGWRRTTLTEVARRAGVSRMTIYRTWADMPQLLGDLMTREWGGVVADSLAEEDRDAPTIERLVGDIVGFLNVSRGARSWRLGSCRFIVRLHHVPAMVRDPAR